MPPVIKLITMRSKVPRFRTIERGGNPIKKRHFMKDVPPGLLLGTPYEDLQQPRPNDKSKERKERPFEQRQDEFFEAVRRRLQPSS